MKSAALNLLLFFCFCYPFHVECSSDDDITPPSDSMEDTCEDDNLLPNTAIAVHISKASDGNWTTDFYASNILSNHSRSLKMSLKKKVIGCGDKKYLSVSGYLKDADVHNSPDISLKEAASNVRGQEERDARSIDSLTIADISVRGKNTESKLISMEETMNKMMLTMENATRYWSIESQTIADMSDRIGNTESKLISIEETINKLILTKDNATRNGNVEEKSNFAFDAIFKGKNIELSNDQRTASRLRPLDVEYYGGVLSNFPLRDDVAFEVRIDETVHKYTEHGIALGVIVKKEEAVKGMPLICFDVRGFYCIRSWWYSDGKSNILKNGSIISDNAYNLDTRHLPVGTTVGVVRRSNNALHFLLNGRDCGSAFENVPDEVYAFFDVSFYVSKVSVIS